MLLQTFYTFVDASNDAHGTVVYSRTTCKRGTTTRRVVAAKTRVVSLAATSIPRFGIDGSSQFQEPLVSVGIKSLSGRTA